MALENISNSSNVGNTHESSVKPNINTMDESVSNTSTRTNTISSDRDNLKLFPHRTNYFLMENMNGSPANSVRRGGGPKNVEVLQLTSSPSSSHRHSRANTPSTRPLLRNNENNTPSGNGLNGAALNQIHSQNLTRGPTTSNSSNRNGGNGKGIGNGNGTAGRKTTADYQRLHRVGLVNAKVRTESFKVIAFICGFFAGILLIMGLASSEWLISSGYRQGLFVYCVGKNVSTVPFVTAGGEGSQEGCHRIDLSEQAYTLVAAMFCVVSLAVDIFGTMLTVLGLRCRDPNRKYKYYRTAVYVMALALVTVLVALVVYPVCFAQIMERSHRPVWEFGWAYGVGWGASIFLFGGVILLLCDKESEEIYYKERTIVQYADSNNKV